MTVAQGISKQVAYKVQANLGAVESGSGGQLLRRVSAAFNVANDVYENNEIASHQQSTGSTHGVGKSSASLQGLASASTYKDFQAALLRKALAATSAIGSLSLTIAASSPNYTITRGSGDFLTGGIKVGDVIRLTGASLDANNVGKNIVVISVTDTVITGNVVNGETLTAEGPIASCTVTVTGKKTWVPTSGHTNLYYTFEEYFADLTRSHVYPDVQVSSLEVSMPATGNVGMNMNFIGLGDVDRSGSQVLTSPTAETSTAVLTAVSGRIYINGVKQPGVTSMTISIDGGVTHGEAVSGNPNIPDTQKGRIKVSGTFTALYESDTLAAFRDNKTTTNIIMVLAEDDSDDADIVTVVLPEVKLFSADADDGEKQIVRSYSFTAQKCSTGGASLANHATIVSIQDTTA